MKVMFSPYGCTPLGTIVFYRHYDRFTDILTHMNVKEQSLCISDDEFSKHYGYDRQALFHILYQSNDMWGFVCSKIQGKSAYKILNSNNKVNRVEYDDIYFALQMDDFSFSHWAEMENDRKILLSPHGKTIMKRPSPTTINKAKFVKKVFGLGENMLYQVVSLEKGSPSYPSSNPFNSQWEKYDAYLPTENAFEQWYNTDVKNTSPWGATTPYYQKWYQGTTTLHAVPFLRDNIKPTTFAVTKQVKSYENDLKMFINFPKGLPIILQ